MAVKYPDILEHNNPDLALVDSSMVRGGRLAVADRAALYALASKADQLKEQVTVVFVASENRDFKLIDKNKAGEVSGWADYLTGAVVGITGLVSAGSVTSNDGIVTITGTEWRINGNTYILSSSYTYQPVPDGSYSRIDIIYGKDDGTLDFIEGTPAENYVPPALPNNTVLVTYVFVSSTGEIGSLPDDSSYGKLNAVNNWLEQNIFNKGVTIDLTTFNGGIGFQVNGKTIGSMKFDRTTRNLQFNRYDASGNYVGSALQVDSATGKVAFTGTAQGSDAVNSNEFVTKGQLNSVEAKADVAQEDIDALEIIVSEKVETVPIVEHYDKAISSDWAFYINQINRCLNSPLSENSIDIFIVAGQSNASGRGDSAQSPTVLATEGLKWDGSTSTFETLADPITGANDSSITGSAWPQFAKTYFEKTGRLSAYVHTSKGGTGADEWSPGTTIQNNAIAAAQAAIAKAETLYDKVNVAGVLWCQGERDGIEGTSESDYKSLLNDVIEDYRSKLNLPELPIFIYELGAKNDGTYASTYQVIRTAQNNYCLERRNAYMVFNRAKYFPSEGKMKDADHYTQAGYNEMGEVSAERVAPLVSISNIKTNLGTEVSLQLIITTKTSSYTLQLSDANTQVRMNSASANNLTVPNSSAVSFSTGDRIEVKQMGAGQTTIQAAAGVTINEIDNRKKLRGQFAMCWLTYVGSNVWDLDGDLIL